MSELDRIQLTEEHSEQNVSGGSTPIVPGIYYPRNRLHRQKSSRPKTRRIVSKTGAFNVERWKPNNNKFSLFSTWFITLVEARWRWTLLNFFAAFTGDWLLFGFIHWAIALAHGDLDEDHLPQNQNGTWNPCVKNIYGFTSTFLFSVEVHTTVAYGRRAITLECPQTIVTMCLQCIVSSIFQAFLVGILFAKMTRPKSRTQTILFSKQLTVSLRNDKLCLIFRVGDVRTSRILNINASVFVMRFDVNDNNMVDNYEQINLKVEMDGCESTFFLWPVTIIHVIDKSSPLYDMSAVDFLCRKIEILGVFEGLIESTGQPIQAKTSYTSKDILWGHRFVPIVSNDINKPNYDVDFSKLSETFAVDTPLCSANEYECITDSINALDANFISDIKFGF